MLLQLLRNISDFDIVKACYNNFGFTQNGRITDTYSNGPAAMGGFNT